ncbi:MAG: hypothetical protein ACTSRY_06535, partial [Alphaproteobacteria bacterium]
VLDSGKLVVVTEPGSLSKGTAKNLLRYPDPIAEKDYDIALSFTADIQDYGGDGTKRIFAGLTLQDATGNAIQFYIANVQAGYNSDSGPYAYFGKRQGGKYVPWIQAQLSRKKTGPIDFHLRIEKRRFKYTGFASLDGDKWVKLGTHALLGKTLTPGLFANRGDKATEAIVEFDSFDILRVER